MTNTLPAGLAGGLEEKDMNKNCKLTKRQARQARELYATGTWTITEIANRYGIATTVALRLLAGRTYKEADGPIHKERPYSRRTHEPADPLAAPTVTERLDLQSKMFEMARREVDDTVHRERERIDRLEEENRELRGGLKRLEARVAILGHNASKAKAQTMDSGDKWRMVTGAILLLGIVSLVTGIYLRYGGAV